MQPAQTPPAPPLEHAERLTKAAAALGYEIVDIAGFLDLVERHAQAQSSGLNTLRARADEMARTNEDVRGAVETIATQTKASVEDVEASVHLVRRSGEQSREVAGWVQNVAMRTQEVQGTLSAAHTDNQLIATIASQVNTLAINAKIEAARAGESGRGFAVFAEAINELSKQTQEAANQISKNIETLTNWISTLGHEASTIAKHASDVLSQAENTDDALVRVEGAVRKTDTQVQRISEHAEQMKTAMIEFTPALSQIEDAIGGTSSGIAQTHDRVFRLIDTSETIVQATARLDSTSVDAPFIDTVLQIASDISKAMEMAVDSGQITLPGLFDRTYRSIPGTDPAQVLTEATALLDTILPPIQEPALEFHPTVVFCAAVDVNGYLPTHNKKFSHPPSEDPVWNMANCRNRRIFDDRVGLKAGRNREPFLLQVYRRDMGGGTFKMMKDLSAPLFVQGRHWGGVRLAYSFE